MNDPVRTLMESLLPPASINDYREQCRKKDEREARLIADVRKQCLEAMGLLVDAASNPRISREEISEAIAKLQGALYWARELDR